MRASTSRGQRVHLGDHVVDVELQGVGPGLLDQPRVLHPAAAGGSVDRSDDRDAHRLAHHAHLLQVLVGPEREAVRLREVGLRLGKGLGVGVESVARGQLLPQHLLFEERAHDDGPGPGVLQATHGVQVVGQGRRTRHEGAGEVQSEIGRREIHETLLL